MGKKNKFDLTPEQLARKGITPEKYQEAGDMCMQFLALDDPKLSKVDKTHICTRILDTQKKNETFSETLKRLGI